MSEESEFLLKVISAGDGTVGKTSIVQRFDTGQFQSSYKMTIGVDFTSKLVSLEDGTICHLQIWDLGGQASFMNVRPLYYKGALGAFIVFDLTNKDSYDNIPSWFDEVYSNCEKIPVVLVGNKKDLSEERVITTEEGEVMAKRMSEEYGLPIPFYEASAKSGENISKLFTMLTSMIIDYIDLD